MQTTAYHRVLYLTGRRLENGFGSRELKKAQKLQQETEAKLEAAKVLIGQKELEIELLKKEQRF